jgi:hypothetical protein
MINRNSFKESIPMRQLHRLPLTLGAALLLGGTALASDAQAGVIVRGGPDRTYVRTPNRVFYQGPNRTYFRGPNATGYSGVKYYYYRGPNGNVYKNF